MSCPTNRPHSRRMPQRTPSACCLPSRILFKSINACSASLFSFSQPTHARFLNVASAVFVLNGFPCFTKSFSMCVSKAPCTGNPLAPHQSWVSTCSGVKPVTFDQSIFASGDESTHASVAYNTDSSSCSISVKSISTNSEGGSPIAGLIFLHSPEAVCSDLGCHFIFPLP